MGAPSSDRKPFILDRPNLERHCTNLKLKTCRFAFQLERGTYFFEFRTYPDALGCLLFQSVCVRLPVRVCVKNGQRRGKGVEVGGANTEDVSGSCVILYS